MSWKEWDTAHPLPPGELVRINSNYKLARIHEHQVGSLVGPYYVAKYVHSRHQGVDRIAVQRKDFVVLKPKPRKE